MALRIVGAGRYGGNAKARKAIRGLILPRVRTLFYDHNAPDRRQEGFRSGEAGLVVPNPDGGLDSDARVQIAPNSLHALEQHRVVDELRRLEFAIGPLAPGRDAVLSPAALEEAAHILYEADRKTYGNTWEFAIGRAEGADQRDPVEYRIVIDNREYQRTLARLQFLVTTAGRQGLGVRLRL
jgi:hypothetical protein